VAEKRRLKKEIKQREESYLARLKKWEDREKRRAKQYDKDEEHEAQRQKTIAREAKKLRQFLEDYQDERDDPKYYKFVFSIYNRENGEIDSMNPSLTGALSCLNGVATTNGSARRTRRTGTTSARRWRR